MTEELVKVNPKMLEIGEYYAIKSSILSNDLIYGYYLRNNKFVDDADFRDCLHKTNVELLYDDTDDMETLLRHTKYKCSFGYCDVYDGLRNKNLALKFDVDMTHELPYKIGFFNYHTMWLDGIWFSDSIFYKATPPKCAFKNAAADDDGDY
jgi:hypothetical protein